MKIITWFLVNIQLLNFREIQLPQCCTSEICKPIIVINKTEETCLEPAKLGTLTYNGKSLQSFCGQKEAGNRCFMRNESSCICSDPCLKYLTVYDILSSKNILLMDGEYMRNRTINFQSFCQFENFVKSEDVTCFHRCNIPSSDCGKLFEDLGYLRGVYYSKELKIVCIVAKELEREISFQIEFDGKMKCVTFKPTVNCEKIMSTPISCLVPRMCKYPIEVCCQPEWGKKCPDECCENTIGYVTTSTAKTNIIETTKKSLVTNMKITTTPSSNITKTPIIITKTPNNNTKAPTNNTKKPTYNTTTSQNVTNNANNTPEIITGSGEFFSHENNPMPTELIKSRYNESGNNGGLNNSSIISRQGRSAILGFDGGSGEDFINWLLSDKNDSLKSAEKHSETSVTWPLYILILASILITSLGYYFMARED